jgi:hypothetical protein
MTDFGAVFLLALVGSYPLGWNRSPRSTLILTISALSTGIAANKQAVREVCNIVCPPR